MITKRLQLIAAWVLVLFLPACTTTLGQQATLNTAALGTIVAQDLQLTQQAGTIIALNQEQLLPTQALGTATITLTPQPLVTPTPQGMWLTINQNTNCREGPATYYRLVTSFKVGDKVEAVARDSNSQYYFVRSPNTSQSFCWLWNQYSSVSGDTGSLPIFTAVPTPTPTITPTPAAGFTVSYDSVISCAAKYALRLYILNTGSTTWKSIDIYIIDNTAGKNFTFVSDTFTAYTDSCTVDTQQGDLAHGEYSYVSNINPGQFGYNPVGHNLTVTVTLYSNDGEAGTSATQTLTIKP